LFRYAMQNRSRWMGLGSVDDVSLAEARQAAEAARRLLRDGRDPIAERDAKRLAAAMAPARAITFSDAVAAFLAANPAFPTGGREAGK